MNSQTQKITLQGEAGAIEALRDEPEGASRGVAIVAHPHPLFGGTMDNKVVQTLARAFVQCGWTVVRFNFRGVGASAGEHDAGAGEAFDGRDRRQEGRRHHSNCNEPHAGALRSSRGAGRHARRRLAARQFAQSCDELHHLDRRAEGRMRRRRNAVLSFRHASRRRNFSRRTEALDRIQQAFGRYASDYVLQTLLENAVKHNEFALQAKSVLV